MRKVSNTPRTEILVGLFLALAHAVFFGIGLYRFNPSLFDIPAVDLSYHAIGFYILDYPAVLAVQLVLQPLGLFYTYPDFWSYALTDMCIYAVGSAYWFAVGYSLVRIGRAIGVRREHLMSLTVAALLAFAMFALISDRATLIAVLGFLALFVVLAASFSALVQLFRNRR